MSTLQARDEQVVKAPLSDVWAIVTDISLLHRINPGVIKATGCMNEPNATRTCEVENKGRKGVVIERLIELVPRQRTVWKVESDTMGLSKMLKDTRFVLLLEELPDSSTRLIAETHYTPANFLARIMNGLMMKRMFASVQKKVLHNIRTVAIIESCTA